MRHFANSDFWDASAPLPKAVQQLAGKSHALLEANPKHPSLHFKKVGNYWSVRVGAKYRALSAEAAGDLSGSGSAYIKSMRH